MPILDGRALADKILNSVKRKVARIKKPLTLAVILVGKSPASVAYVRMKKKSAEKVGIKFQKIDFPETISEKKLLAEIDKLNRDKKITGFIVQLPLPKKINELKIISAIDPAKDVDGFHPLNFGKGFLNMPALLPATPAGMMRLLDEYKIDLVGKEVVVIGRSNIVGKPMAVLLINRGATVTVCNRRTKDLAGHTKKADIIIAAAGVPNLVKAGMVKKGVVVVDAGCAKVGDKLVGDVDFQQVKKKASFITPVPGGVGPMTVATLIENTLLASEKNF